MLEAVKYFLHLPVLHLSSCLHLRHRPASNNSLDSFTQPRKVSTSFREHRYITIAMLPTYCQDRGIHAQNLGSQYIRYDFWSHIHFVRTLACQNAPWDWQYLHHGPASLCIESDYSHSACRVSMVIIRTIGLAVPPHCQLASLCIEFGLRSLCMSCFDGYHSNHWFGSTTILLNGNSPC